MPRCIYQAAAVPWFSAQQDEGKAYMGLPTGSSACYVVTDQLDLAFKSALDAGAEVVQPPHETAFGTGISTWALTVRDPEGNLWTFGIYTGSA
jgi:uncharacterized glyoxalase superfamily protein PhnB